MEKKTYLRMYETKNVRPYYTVTHLGIFGTPFKNIVGFEYKDTVYVTSPDMNNTGYFEVGEMARATEYFRAFWENGPKVRALLADIRETFKRADAIEKYGWKQKWSKLDTPVLLKEAEKFEDLLFKTFTRMIVSQPQHVLSLDQKINKSLEKYSNRDQLIIAATYHDGDLPWKEEEEEIESLHKKWNSLAEEKKLIALDGLVEKYGWFNEIEGDKPFDMGHYEKKIIGFTPGRKDKPEVDVPDEIAEVGRLIGELGFLRFWNRYHFMSIRYHLKKILTELVARSGKHELEFATVDEIGRFFSGNEIDLDEIRRRKDGYASRLINGRTEILTGLKAVDLIDLVKEDATDSKEVKGSVANKGRVSGKVRVISFVAEDYSKEVAAFKKGEILVTGMTRPQIVHLCKLAAAIVTDEGGITSHAAVVSREFQIPCIIATHNATKVLKTGDMVEVDANEGVVRKIG